MSRPPSATANRASLALLNAAPLILFVAMVVVFSLLAPNFREWRNVENILVQSATTGVLAVGMTFVLLTAGVDLSVGAIMFVCAALGGKLIFQGAPFWPVVLSMPLLGVACGLFNGIFVTRFKIMPFIVTLATLYLGRGLGLWVTETRAMNLPETFHLLGAGRWWGLPLPVWVLAGVVLMAHGFLLRTQTGRQIYAVGHDPEAARKAGIPVTRILLVVYAVSGFCAAVAAVVNLSQAPAVNPNFGAGKEFDAIAAAVLGGASLFGGKGRVFPGTILGAVLLQTVNNGLNILNVNPYLYPMITSAIIFVAVLVDGIRSGFLAKLGRRRIRVETVS